MTAFYMFRLFFMVFTGEARSPMKNVHESPSTMTYPMILLGVLAIIAGYVQTPFNHNLGAWLVDGNEALGHSHIEGPIWIMIAATVVSLAENLPCILDLLQAFESHATGFLARAIRCTVFLPTNITLTNFIK